MVKVKICGITNQEDARASVLAGADLLGFNFFRPSPRLIEPSSAREIIDGIRSETPDLSQSVKMVGVFVNESSPQAVLDTVRVAGLDAVQLHGDETPEFCAKLKRLWQPGFIIKVLRVDKQFEPASASQYNTEAIMLDAFHSSLRGGTGQTIDWKKARSASEIVPRLFLAGGLSPENVAEAIREVQPFAVDACSSLETAPGVKNIARVQAFVRAVRNS